MTNTIDGLSLPVRLPIDGDAFDAACDYAREHGLTISQAASEMLRNFAPPVETLLAPATPGDGRGDSGEPPAPLSPVLSASNVRCMVDPYEAAKAASKAKHPSSLPAPTIDTPRPHVHLAGPCVYGDRCGA